jgi:hypothetical protein
MMKFETLVNDLACYIESQNNFANNTTGKIAEKILRYLASLYPEQEKTEQSAKKELEEAKEYATRLARSLHDKYYARDTIVDPMTHATFEVSSYWEPLPDLLGLLTQIDNMTTGLTRIKEEPKLAWDTYHNRDYEPVETLAKKIYDSYEGPIGQVKPEWVPHGNSAMQDHARQEARRYLRLMHHTPKNSYR